MSTKTLRKRIALVAVSALGAGLLAIVAGPAANAATGTITAVPIQVKNNGSTSSTSQGIVAGSTGADLTGTSNTATVLSTGVIRVQVATTTAATGNSGEIVKVSVSGGYIADAAGSTGATATIDSSQLYVTSTGTAATLGTVTIKGNSTAAPTVITTSYSNDTGSTYTTSASVTVTTVLAGTVNVFSAGKSYFAATSTGSVSSGLGSGLSVANAKTGTLTSNTDAQITAWQNGAQAAAGSAAYPATTLMNGGVGYFGYNVKDGNGVALISPVVSASTTGGCVLNTSDAAGSATFAYSSSAAAYFRVDKPTANVPASCVVTISVNGTVAASRTFTFNGQVAKIKITYNSIAKKGAVNKDVVYFDAQDSVGSSLDGVTVSADGTYFGSALSGFTLNGVSAPYGGNADDNGNATLSCNSSDSYKLKLKATADDTSTVRSDEFTVVCAGSPVNYKAALDKSSYVPGDIATVTITATDSAGKATYDAATVGSGASIAGSNLTAVTAPTAGDTFTSGVKKYKFTVGSTEGNYQLVVDLPAYDSTTYNQAAVTLPYTIKASSASVTNAEVLAAIVKLIASINKQIAALQKALMKK